MPDFELAQINIARLRAPVDDPQIKDFVDLLDPINTLAERSRGFVWRLVTDSGNATDIVAFDDPRIIVNMSVWQSVDALHDYVFNSGHLAVFKRKKEWFHPSTSAHLALWWIPQGHRPTVDEASARLQHIDAHGITAQAFTLSRHLPAPFALSGVQQTVPAIRPATAEDAPAVVELLAANNLPVEDLDIERWTHGPGAWSLCANDSDGKIIAAAAMEPCANDALLRSVVVAESARGQGLARTLASRVEVLARERGIQRLFLLTDTAVDVFKTLGYSKAKRSDVPNAVAATRQFAELCPDSAACLCKRL